MDPFDTLLLRVWGGTVNVIHDGTNSQDGMVFMHQSLADCLKAGRPVVLLSSLRTEAAHRGTLRKLGVASETLAKAFVVVNSPSHFAHELHAHCAALLSSGAAGGPGAAAAPLYAVEDVAAAFDDEEFLDRHAGMRWLRGCLQNARSASGAAGAVPGSCPRVLVRINADGDVRASSVAATSSGVSLLHYLTRSVADVVTCVTQTSTGFARDVHGRITVLEVPAVLSAAAAPDDAASTSAGGLGGQENPPLFPPPVSVPRLSESLYRLTDSKIKQVGDLKLV